MEVNELVCGQLGAPYRRLACGACNKSHGGLGVPPAPNGLWGLPVNSA